MKMIKKFVSLALFFVILLANVNLVKSENKGEFSFTIAPGYTVVDGVRTQIGDEYVSRRDYRPGLEEPTDTLRYGISYKPIDPKINNKLTYRVECSYQKNKWEIAGNFWWFSSNNEVRGRVETPKRISYGEYFTQFQCGVRMWEHTITPLRNDLHPSRYSPVHYHARNEMRVWMGNGFFRNTLIETKNSEVKFYCGIKTAGFKMAQSNGLSQIGWANDYFGTGTHLCNHNEMKSEAESTASFLLGPMIGIIPVIKGKILEIKAELAAGVLAGKIQQRGLWSDIDRIYQAKSPEVKEPYLYLKGEFPFFREQTTFIPCLDTTLQVNLKIVDTAVLDLRMGIGGSFSLWGDVPTVPQWYIPGDWTALEGTRWQTSKNDLKFYSVQGNINVAF